MAIGAASRFRSWSARTPSPLPIAINGASGPSTTPRLNVANAARVIPGSSIGGTAPEAWNPSAGECPPVPGRYLIDAATSRPLSARNGAGHQLGAPWKPRSLGSVSKRYCWASAMTFRKKYATVATGTPMIAPIASKPR